MPYCYQFCKLESIKVWNLIYEANEVMFGISQASEVTPIFFRCPKSPHFLQKMQKKRNYCIDIIYRICDSVLQLRIYRYAYLASLAILLLKPMYLSFMIYVVPTTEITSVKARNLPTMIQFSGWLKDRQLASQLSIASQVGTWCS